LQVGKGRLPASVVADVIAGKCDHHVEWPSIPAHGLCLMKVSYPDCLSVDLASNMGQNQVKQFGLGEDEYEEN
jgi:tRNA U38,U39,U40 pseudouridine synthase TruA